MEERIWDERAYLKVKIKSLAAEAKIIRLEEKRAKLGSIRDGLADHRRGIVRTEARHAQLAYGFLRGKEYKQIEAKAHEAPDWSRVRKMVQKYGIHRAACEWKQAIEGREEMLKRFDAWAQTTEVVS